MPFDLASAKPVESSGGFDLASAKPVDAPEAQEAPKEGYFDKLERTGQQFDKAVGTGIKGLAKTVGAAGEVAGSMFSGMAGDIAGAATSVATQDPAKGKSVKEAMTYQPRTEGGKAAAEYVGALAEPVTNLLSMPGKKLDEWGHPIAAQVANAAIDVAGGREGAKAPGRAMGALDKAATEIKPQAAVADGAVELARKHKIILKPSEGGGGLAGKTAEGLAGSPKLEVEASVKNQPKINKLAADEIGVKGPLTPAALAKAKKPHNAIYDRVGKELGEVPTDEQFHTDLQNVGRTPGTSFQNAKSPAIDKLKEAYAEQRFNAADALQETRKLRAAANKNIKAPFDPERNELGFAQREISDAIENQMERHGESIGKGELMGEFQNARKQLAKIHSVQGALITADGEVSAHALAKQAKKGAPLSGNLKDIADIANNFPNVVRPASKLKNRVPVTVLEGAAGISGMALHNPTIAAGMVARPLTRQFLMSDMYQKGLTKAEPATLKDWSGKDVPNVETKPTYTSKPAAHKYVAAESEKTERKTSQTHDEFIKKYVDDQPVDKYEHKQQMQELVEEIQKDWSNGSSDSYSGEFGPDKIHAKLKSEGKSKYYDEDGDLTDAGSERYNYLEQELSEKIASEQIGSPKKKTVDLSRPEDAAEIINRYAEKIGLNPNVIGGSGKSSSKYFSIEDGSGKRLNIRISDHELPDHYTNDSNIDIVIPKDADANAAIKKALSNLDKIISGKTKKESSAKLKDLQF